MKNLIIVNEKKFRETEKRFKEDGLGKVHVLTDFDKTLTNAFVDGERIPSLISVLRDGNYLNSSYRHKAQEFYEKYHPIENDFGVSREEKKRLMAEWWNAHYNLLIESGLNKKDIEKAVESRKVKLREGFSEFADFLKDKDVPLIVISAAGLGQKSISQKLKQDGRMYDNIHIISNAFEWDKEGRAVAVKKPIVHVANKDEVLVESFPEIFREIKDRKNVVLLGDSLDDVDMVKGFNYDNLIKIGFLNSEIEAKEEKYRELYDVLILNDSSMDFVNLFLQKIANDY